MYKVSGTWNVLRFEFSTELLMCIIDRVEILITYCFDFFVSTSTFYTQHFLWIIKQNLCHHSITCSANMFGSISKQRSSGGMVINCTFVRRNETPPVASGQTPDFCFDFQITHEWIELQTCTVVIVELVLCYCLGHRTDTTVAMCEWQCRCRNTNFCTLAFVNPRPGEGRGNRSYNIS